CGTRLPGANRIFSRPEKNATEGQLLRRSSPPRRAPSTNVSINPNPTHRKASCTRSSSFASKGLLGFRPSGYEISGLKRSRHRWLTRSTFPKKRTNHVFDWHFLHVNVADITGLD